MATLRYYLLFDHIKIHGANAISSPLTYGFPAISGFLGAIHALSRSIEPESSIYLDGVMVACHDCDVQVYRPHNFADYTFKLTRNPIGRDGKTRAIIEEGKVHLDVSLVVEVICESESLADETTRALFIKQMQQKILQQRIAGGFVLAEPNVQLYDYFGDYDGLINRLLPGFVLVDAKNDLLDITQELQQEDPSATMLDALIATAKLQHNSSNDGWQSQSVKQGRGWLVPIHLGYQGISPLFEAGQVAFCRDNQQPVQFTECIYGLGKWLFPHRLRDNFSSAFWRYQPATKQSNDADLYLIYQEYTDE